MSKAAARAQARKTDWRAPHSPKKVRAVRGNRLTVALACIVFSSVRLLPPAWGSALGGAIFCLLGSFLHQTRNIQENLRAAFPHLSQCKIDGLARKIWINFGRICGEWPHLASIRHSRRGARVEVEGLEHVLALQGRPAIFATAHIGNWEVGPLVMANAGLEGIIAYTPFPNPKIAALIQSARSATGYRYVPKERIVSACMAALHLNRSVGLLVDQRVDGGAMIPFLGRSAATTTLPARLAIKFDCPVILVEIRRVGGAKFKVVIDPPLKGDLSLPHCEAVIALTARMNERVSEWIRARPGDWFCAKRRWQQGRTKSARGISADSVDRERAKLTTMGTG